MTKESIDLLYRKYNRRMRGLAYNILKNRSDAEDAVHTVFVRLLKGYNLTNVERIEFFLLTMVKNASYDIKKSLYWRRAQISDTIEKMHLPDDNQCSQEQQAIAKSELKLVINALDKLDENKRKTLIAHRLEKAAISQIIAMTGKSERTIQNHVKESVDYLKAILKR